MKGRVQGPTLGRSVFSETYSGWEAIRGGVFPVRQEDRTRTDLGLLHTLGYVLAKAHRPREALNVKAQPMVIATVYLCRKLFKHGKRSVL